MTTPDPDSPTIALVEDDIELARLTRERLQREGFTVLHEGHGVRAAEVIVDKQPDLVVLDIMLPGIDGFEVCRRIRPNYDGPILILTAKDDDVDQILGLELGADDFVTKPVKPRLLIARIRALLRRSKPREPEPEPQSPRLELGELVVDASRREAHLGGDPIDLTTVEFDMLYYLTARAGQTVSRQDIYRELFQHDYDGLDRSVDVYVSRLRRKLGDNPSAAHYIKTVRGVGYLMAAAEPS